MFFRFSSASFDRSLARSCKNYEANVTILLLYYIEQHFQILIDFVTINDELKLFQVKTNQRNSSEKNKNAFFCHFTRIFLYKFAQRWYFSMSLKEKNSRHFFRF